MSLIYKSLQQLKSTQGTSGTTSPYAQLHTGTVWPWKSIVAVTVLTVLMLAMFLFVRQQIQNNGPNNPARLNTSTRDSDIRRPVHANIPIDSNEPSAPTGDAPRSTAGNSQEKSKADGAVQHAKTQSPTLPHPPLQSTSSFKKKHTTDTGSPGDNVQTKLSTAFREKARRNQFILDMENQLRSSLNDPSRFAATLAELQQKAGTKNAVVDKWQGIQALQNNEFAAAEQFFAAYIQKSGPDIAIQINIILAQIGQDKMTEAQNSLHKLLKKYPENTKLNSLKTYLTKN